VVADGVWQGGRLLVLVRGGGGEERMRLLRAHETLHKKQYVIV
jgi:hypothetical protein